MLKERYGFSGGLKRLFTVLAIAVFVLIVGLGGLIASNYKDFGNLFKVIMLVRTQYLNPVDYSAMVDGAIGGVVRSLDDPYSVYLDPPTYKQLKEQIQGSFGGLGILVGIKDDYITVVKTFAGTPAYVSGILPGDIIYRIDDREARGLDLDTAVQLMRGPVGTGVKLTLGRPGKAEPFEVTLEREEISVPSVESSMKENNIAYMVISQFTVKTPAEVSENIDKLKKQGMRGMILDLRDNPGGELMSVVKVAENFVPAGPVVFIEYKGGRMEEHDATGKNLNIPLVVLINEGSASAAEILAGAVKDTGAGVLVGQKTFGKGVVQMIFDLDNGAGLKLTTARYLTTNKNDINKQGIMPDVVVEQQSGGPDLQMQKALDIMDQKLGIRPAA
ncbi:MAG: S41 family peptidase [Bacillota bacterium]